MNNSTAIIIGASKDRSKFGNKAVRAHLQAGYQVYPVNPQGGEIEGLMVYESIGDVPLESVDRVSIYLPPQVTMSVLKGVATKRPKEVWFNPGTSTTEVIEKAHELKLPVTEGCSIVDLGMTPGEFTDE